MLVVGRSGDVECLVGCWVGGWGVCWGVCLTVCLTVWLAVCWVGGCYVFCVFVVGVDDVFDEGVSDDVSLVELDDGDAFDVLQSFDGVFQSGLL